MAPTILERGLPICGLKTNHENELVDDFFNSTYRSLDPWFIFYKMDCQSNAKPSEKDHDLPGTFGLAVSIPNHFLRLSVD
jgi:hypothetical protein